MIVDAPCPPLHVDEDRAIECYDGAHAPLLVFADDPARRTRLSAIAAERGARAVAMLPIAEAAARLDYQVSGLILIEVAGDGGPALDRLLDHVEATAGAGLGSVVIAGAGTLDLVARALGLPSTMLLVAPDDAEIGAVIDELLAPREMVVADSGSDAANGRRLRQLSEEVGRIARTLANLSAGTEAAPAVTLEPRSAVSRLQTARAEIRVRRLRDQFFDPGLFADPAWDMLLDLAAAALERRRVAVSSLCIAAAVPATTALRWIAQMTDQGLLARYPDPDDGRRVFIALTETATTGMTRYLDACAAARAG